jgi:hypothetical protein
MMTDATTTMDRETMNAAIITDLRAQKTLVSAVTLG